MNILVIEDQPAYSIGLIAVLRSFFNLKNIACETCLISGIEKLKRDHNSIDVVFISINTTNTELVESFKDEHACPVKVPVIVLSSLLEQQNQLLLSLPSVSAVISKNTHQEQMLNQIKSILIKNGFNPSPNNKNAVPINQTNPFIQNNKTNKSIITVTQENKTLLNDACFQFHVSADEEHTFVSANHNNRSFDFGERAHHYLLLLLARQRHTDYQNGYDEESQGWLEISELQDMLGLDYCHLNIQIFRARKQINTKMSSGDELIEILQRRVGSIRFAARQCSIIKAGKLESNYKINSNRLIDCIPEFDSVA
jgi:DNA-binding NarL/FixJ family response regulator